jgi:hypothetical protein
VGCAETIERSPNTHTFSEVELQEKAWKRR